MNKHRLGTGDVSNHITIKHVEINYFTGSVLVHVVWIPDDEKLYDYETTIEDLKRVADKVNVSGFPQQLALSSKVIGYLLEEEAIQRIAEEQAIG